MCEKHVAPWNPDRKLADFFTVVLPSVILFLASGQLCHHCDGLRSFDDVQLTINGKVEDVILGASSCLRFPLVSRGRGLTFLLRLSTTLILMVGTRRC